MAKNPVEEFLLEKKAFGAQDLRRMGAKAAPALRNVGAQAGNAALAGAGAAAFAGAVGAAGKLYAAATKTRDFNAMLESNPDLHYHLEQAPGGFNRLFTSLRTFSPEFTRDPLMAGNFMRRGMDSNVEDRGDIVTRALAARPRSNQHPAAEAAMGGFMKGVGSSAPEKKPQLQRQLKSVFKPGDNGQPNVLERVEETQHYHG